jgi:23S rRNA (uracil1939-C5)-methyltransferase
MERVRALLAPERLGALEVGALWHLAERLQFVRDNVEPAHLPADFAAQPGAEGLWGAFTAREGAVLLALAEASGRVGRALHDGALPPAAFRSTWEGLGYTPHAEGGGTPADDFLDGTFHIARLTLGEARPAFGTVNMASRARRIADFLAVTRPAAGDVVFDLGSGAGKLALTVAASSAARVQGVELGPAYVEAARGSAARLGLGNAGFLLADAREVDLSAGTIFYLYYPFHGEVARAVAGALGRLGRERDITVYASGPEGGYGEHFLAEVERGSLRLCERRGEHADVLVLRSARA